MNARPRACWLAVVLLAALPAVAKDGPDGAAIFKDKSSFCHGAKGHPLPALADKGVRDFSDPVWAKTATDEKIRQTIAEGGAKGTLMRRFAKELTAEQIAAAAAYVKTLAPHPGE